MTLPVVHFKTSPATGGLSFTNSSEFYQQIELKTVMTLPKEKAIYILNKLLTMINSWKRAVISLKVR